MIIGFTEEFMNDLIENWQHHISWLPKHFVIFQDLIINFYKVNRLLSKQWIVSSFRRGRCWSKGKNKIVSTETRMGKSRKKIGCVSVAGVSLWIERMITGLDSNLSHFGKCWLIMSDVNMSTGDASQVDEAVHSPETCVPTSPSSPSPRSRIKSEDGSDIETKLKGPEGGRLQFYFGNILFEF